MEALGILLLAPLVDTMSSSINDNFISRIIKNFSNKLHLDYYFAFFILFGSVYTIKALVLTLLIYQQSKFAFTMQQKLSEKVL